MNTIRIPHAPTPSAGIASRFPLPDLAAARACAVPGCAPARPTA
ncbi:hypothetical protein [Pseudomonas sp. GD03944]|nr:hypothetical protein [Pseudomonas sp. GD03944]MDH1262702.1 hypothetical protein [Pseudomonas sp. GD03944]